MDSKYTIELKTFFFTLYSNTNFSIEIILINILLIKALYNLTLLPRSLSN